MSRNRPVPDGESLNPASESAFQAVREDLERAEDAAGGPFVVGIGGPGGSGKSVVAHWLCRHLSGAIRLSLDDFRLPRAQRPSHGRFGSHPEANDLPRLKQTLADFRRGRPICQPVFDPVAGRVMETRPLPAARILLADGEIAAHETVRRWLDWFVLVEDHWRRQLNVRLGRDLRSRHCSLEKAIDIFLHSNLRDYPRFAAGAREAAQTILYCTMRRTFLLRRPPRFR